MIIDHSSLNIPAWNRWDIHPSVAVGLVLFGGSQVRTSAHRELWCGAARVVPRVEWPAAQSVRYISVQRAHGAASVADARLSAAAPVRHAGARHPPVAPAALGHGFRARGHAAARGRADFFRADRPLARAGALRS